MFCAYLERSSKLGFQLYTLNGKIFPCQTNESETRGEVMYTPLCHCWSMLGIPASRADARLGRDALRVNQ